MSAPSPEHPLEETTYETRDYRPSDAADLCELFQTSINVLATDFTTTERQSWADSAHSPAFTTQLQDAWLRVAETEEDGLIGFAGIFTHGEISHLYVAPATVRQGVASTLLEDLYGLAAAMGHTQLKISAPAQTRSFLQHHGFQETGPHNQNFGTNSLSFYLFQRALTNPKK